MDSVHSPHHLFWGWKKAVEQLFCDNEVKNHVLRMAEERDKVAWGTNSTVELLCQPCMASPGLLVMEPKLNLLFA